MKLLDQASLSGHLTIKVFNADRILLHTYEDFNQITELGLQQITFLLTGQGGNHRVTQIGAGEGTADTDHFDTALTNPYLKTVDGHTYDDLHIVRFKFSLDTGDANGLNISEWGLFSGEDSLFSRKLQSPVIPKSNDIIIEGEWTISVFQCREYGFASNPIVRFATSTDLEIKAVLLPFASQANISSNIVSDGTQTYYEDFTGMANDAVPPVEFTVLNGDPDIQSEQLSLKWDDGDTDTANQDGVLLDVTMTGDFSFEADFHGNASDGQWAGAKLELVRVSDGQVAASYYAYRESSSYEFDIYIAGKGTADSGGNTMRTVKITRVGTLISMYDDGNMVWSYANGWSADLQMKAYTFRQGGGSPECQAFLDNITIYR